jgi:SAM-dependent methyltransferase
MTRWSCRLCGTSQSLALAWELTPSPYGDLFGNSKEAAKALAPIGLSLLLCNDCGLLQLAQDVDATQIYAEYIYQTSVTVGLPEYYRRLASRLTRDLSLESGDLVVDVGSNDGTGLKPFLETGIRVVGVEPSRGPAQKSVHAGVPTINSFLDERTVEEINRTHGRAALVCANAVVANVPDPVAFVRHMGAMLAPEGALSIVTGYHPDQFAINMFDYINHDHLSYFSVTSAVRLAHECHLRLVSAERVEHKGGSIHLVFRHCDSEVKPDESIEKILQRERWLQVGHLQTYQALASRINGIADQIHELAALLPDSGAVGIGASISTTHLLSQFGIGNRVSRLFDDDPRKIGRFSPGFGIEVSDLGTLGLAEQDRAFILSWQHTDALLRRVYEVGYRGQVVVPLPRPYVASV